MTNKTIHVGENEQELSEMTGIKSDEVKEPSSTLTLTRNVTAATLLKGVKNGKGLMRVVTSEYITPDEADDLVDMIRTYAEWLRHATADEITRGSVTFLEAGK